jgi:hypothetical protein
VKPKDNVDFFVEFMVKKLANRNFHKTNEIEAIQNNARGAKNANKLAQTKAGRLFRKKQGSSTKSLQSRLSDIGVAGIQ